MPRAARTPPSGHAPVFADLDDDWNRQAMALVSVHQLTVAFGGDAPLLDAVGCHLEPGERIALVGRNGAGKSTLMRVLAGDLEPDQGSVATAPGTRIARLDQGVPDDVAGDVFDVVAGGLPEVGALLGDYHRLSSALDGARDLARLEQVQHQLEAAGAWHLERRVETVMSRLQLPPSGRFETLSGGLKRRVLLGRALVAEPDLLLLDEPTNHLDIPAIEWLEELLLGFAGTLLFVTHDRAFLRRLATRILELDRGRLRDWPGDYGRYLAQKEHLEGVETEQRARFDKKLAQEEAWVRQGIKARRTRNEGRVRALERLREERRQRRSATGRARLPADEVARSGKIVIETAGLGFAFDHRPLVADLTTTVLRGDKVGILGANGSGKTTLIKLLLGRLPPAAGRVRHGTGLEIAYFDQHREQLDPERTVSENLAEGNDTVVIGGVKRHVISYLQSFLFPPDRIRSPVSSLSGGERNRLLLARLFTRPFNLLVMDEPTNDLDVETLELLEDRLLAFTGTLLLVSHDRDFLDSVVTNTLVLEGGGRVGSYAGGYSDYLLQRPAPEPPPAAPKPAPERPTRSRQPARKLSYRERRDLESLPGRIEALESEQATLHRRLADPDLYRTGDGEAVVRARDRLAEVEQSLEAAYARWAELEARSA